MRIAVLPSPSPVTPVVDDGLGNTTYLVDLGDGRALVVDSSRDLRAVRAAAERRSLVVAFAADTHLHADFVSGARQLAAGGATVLASAAGRRQFAHVGLRDGDEVDLGGLTLRALATPGHTHEHLAFLLLDGSVPLGVFTGGSLLVGAAARTDLVAPERTEELARAQSRSLQRLARLDDAVAVWPTHGAGSFCSAPPGAQRTSTIGAEKATNALLRAESEDAFVEALLGSLGTFPPYFGRLPELNRRGPALVTVGPARRGTAMGLNEAAGYAAVAATALATGYLAEVYGLRPAPFLLGVAFAALGLGLSTLAVHETRGHAHLEAANHQARADRRHGHLPDQLSDRQVFAQTSFRDPALSSASQAGLVNNLNDGLAWGLFPVLFAAAGLSVARVGVLTALYPAVWGVGQLVTGALSDRWGRKWLIATGMWVQAVGLALAALSDDFAWWAVAGVLLGAGTAMVYPTLLASIGDVAPPAWRARAVGIYRLWRDGGFAVGALLAGLVADLAGVRAAVWTVAVLTAVSGLVVALRMYETHHRPATA